MCSPIKIFKTAVFAAVWSISGSNQVDGRMYEDYGSRKSEFEDIDKHVNLALSGNLDPSSYYSSHLVCECLPGGSAVVSDLLYLNNLPKERRQGLSESHAITCLDVAEVQGRNISSSILSSWDCNEVYEVCKKLDAVFKSVAGRSGPHWFKNAFGGT